MRVDIHLPRGLTAGEYERLIVAAMREAERIRRERRAQRRRAEETAA